MGRAKGISKLGLSRGKASTHLSTVFPLVLLWQKEEKKINRFTSLDWGRGGREAWFEVWIEVEFPSFRLRFRLRFGFRFE